MNCWARSRMRVWFSTVSMWSLHIDTIRGSGTDDNRQ